MLLNNNNTLEHITNYSFKEKNLKKIVHWKKILFANCKNSIRYSIQFITFCLFKHNCRWITRNLRRIPWTYLLLWKFEIRFGIWCQKKRLGGTATIFTKYQFQESTIKSILNVTCYMLLLLLSVAFLFCFVVFFCF